MEAAGPVSCIIGVTWLAGDVKEPTHCSQRVRFGVTGVVVWPCGLVLRVGALHMVNSIPPFPLEQNCPRKIAMLCYVWLCYAMLCYSILERPAV